MSVSRFRHSTGHVAKPQHHFLNVTSSTALWDGSNTISCNDKFIAVPWQTFGGTAVFRHEAFGRLAPNPPLVLGQKGQIIDVKFDPFDNQKLFTAGEDGSIFGWSIPTEGLQSNITSPLVELNGHNKKCGIISFHPNANGILASAGVDRVINVWDVERGTAVNTINSVPDYATGLEWNLRGSLFCIVSRDKTLRVIDPRKCTVVSSVESHASVRSQRCIWCKRKDTIMTLGWNKSQQRQIKLWDTRKMEKPYSSTELDQSSAAFIPVFDEDLNLLIFGSKGENKMKCFELMNEGLIFSCDVSSNDPMKGLCMLPKWSLDVRKCEFDRLYQLTYHSLYTIEMLLPRKQSQTEFQGDVFPSTFADHSAISADDFFSGTDADPREYDLADLFNGHSPCLIGANTSSSQKTSVEEQTEKPLKGAPKGEAVTGHENSSISVPPSCKTTSPSRNDTTTKHADPCADVTQREIFDKQRRLQELSGKVRIYHQEISALRKALQEKEAEMLKVLEDIESI
ncbi:coronin, putative [Leishmania tarentolae]|uniref:Coronin n=1 Tax=Leishmania tarentolae TaxID=5689 RepID=A0A640KIA8_LEITA|nr:coronin, putative [Leishmania tarentolae]